MGSLSRIIKSLRLKVGPYYVMALYLEVNNVIAINLKALQILALPLVKRQQLVGKYL